MKRRTFGPKRSIRLGTQRSIRLGLVLLVALLTGLLAPLAIAQPPAATTQKIEPALPHPLVQAYNDLPLTSDDAVQPLTAGGPDLYGYTFLDSDEASGPIYSWVEITGTNQIPFGDLTSHGPFSIGFPFNYYGTDYTGFYAGSDGILTFGAGATAAANQCPLPDPSAPNNLIAAIWDDLDNDTATPLGTGWYQAYAAGTCPYGGYTGACLVVEWKGMYHKDSSPPEDLTFEIILFDNDQFLIQMADVGGEDGSGSTTGIEAAGGASGLAYSCDTTDSITDTLAIQFYHPQGAPQLDASYKTASATKIEAGSLEPLTYTIVISNSGDAGALDASMTDYIPAYTSYLPGSLDCSSGDCWQDGATVYWAGAIASGADVIVEFAVDTTQLACGEAITNTAIIADPAAPTGVPVQTTTGVASALYAGWDFESGDGGFVATNDWLWGVPAYPPGLGAHSGARVWATVLDGPYGNLGDWSVLTKSLDLTAYPPKPPLTLEWWHYLKAGGSSSDYAQVLIDGDLLFDSSLEGDTPGDTYVPATYDISAYAGQVVDLVFQFWATAEDSDDGWYIDDVTVYAGCPQPGIAVDAPPLEAELCPPETFATELTICNDGSAPLEWTLAETPAALAYLDQVVTVQVPAIEARPGVSARLDASGQPARQFDMHVGWVSLQPIDLLLVTPDVVGNGDISLLLATLAAFPDLNVTLWDGNAGTPGVPDMMGYDVVFLGNDIVWESSNIDKTEFSDNLASYIDNGGKVLASNYVWSWDEWGLGGGRFIEQDYSPYEVATGDYPGLISLGNYDAGHPIMTGITTATEGYIYQDQALSPIGAWVASWQDGENYVAVAPNAVGLNQLHFHQADFGGQTGELLHNAMLYLVSSGEETVAPWLSEEPLGGTLEMDECATVAVTLYSRNMDPGTYEANLLIESNDPAEPQVTLPVAMTVYNCTGWLQGRVLDLETGLVDPPCTPAELRLEPGDLTLPLEPDGSYHTRLVEGAYTLTASAPGYEPDTSDVDVAVDMTTTQDLSLMRPVFSVEPTNFISVNVLIDTRTTFPLVIANDGHVPLSYGITGIPATVQTAGSGVSPSPAFTTTWLEGDIEVDPLLFAELEARGRTEFFVQMRLQADLSPAYDIQDWNLRGQYVYDALKKAAAAQDPILNYATSRGLSYETRLSNNSVLIKGGTLDDLQALAARADVRQVRANRVHQLEDAHALAPTAYGWNLGTLDPNAGSYGMEAAQVWSEFDIDGDGVVVASIDTGAFYQHEALVRQYRGSNSNGTFDHDYNWYAPTITASVQCDGEAAIAPCDERNHGTGTIGIMVGETEDLVEQNGAAPGAQWIACMGCDGYGSGNDDGCSDAALTACADWMIAPCPIGADPGDQDCRPAMRPHIINNSWGDVGCDDWFDAYVAAWRAAGQFPAFSAGNTVGCGTVGSPGDTPEAFGTAAHDASGQNQYAGGPSCYFPTPSCDPDAHQIDPHLNAPSFARTPTNIPDAYYYLTGTSGASPHTAGCVALIWSANPLLTGDVETTFTILEQTADRTSTQSWAGGDCGKPACAGTDTYPNYEYGWGYLDCYAAVQAATQVNTNVPWLWARPGRGMIPSLDTATIDVTFLCTETRDYLATLSIENNDPCDLATDVPIQIHCVPEPFSYYYLPIILRNGG